MQWICNAISCVLKNFLMRYHHFQWTWWYPNWIVTPRLIPLYIAVHLGIHLEDENFLNQRDDVDLAVAAVYD